MDTQAIMIQYLSQAEAEVAAVLADKRAANCRAFQYDAAGKVVGINLVHVPIPSAPYELVLAELVDEYAAQGNTVVTVAIYNADGILTAERAMMAWPFPALDAEESPAGPGNTDNRFATTSKFPSNSIGPLAFHVGDAQGKPLSDIIGGYGLPDGHHISGRVTFRARGVINPVEPPDPDEPPVESDLTTAVGRCAQALERLAEHLGA